MMIITKDEKQLYSFLKDAFNVMGRSRSKKFLLGDGGALYFNTFYVKGKITLKRRKNVKGKLVDTNVSDFGQSFYTLKMLDDKSFELKEDKNMSDSTEEHNSEEGRELRVETLNYFEDNTFSTSVGEDLSTLLSTITRHTHVLIPDRYLGLISKMGGCDVYVKARNIMVEKETFVEKEEITVKKSLVFICDYDQEDEENE